MRRGWEEMADVAFGDIDESSDLLERELALEQLAADVADARHGHGRLTLISGSPGVGKTAVARRAASQASSVGIRVLRARGAVLEREFAFGVVRQLFERVRRTSDPDERSRLLGGPARAAGALLGASRLPDLRDESRSFAYLHGLHGLLVNLAEGSPICIVIDDAHWADAASLRWFSYLAGRLDDVAALALLVTRERDLSVGDPGLAAIATDPNTRTIVIEPLSSAATSILVKRQFGHLAAPEFESACHRVTGGNPFFLGELLRALRNAHVPATPEGAPRVAEQGPATLARSVLLRTAALSPDAAALARALAVLGDDAELHDAAALASLDGFAASEAARRLAEEQVIVGERRLSFTHPIVQASIYADIPGPSRADAHARAAAQLGRSGAPAERLAAHLLMAYSAGDAWTVQVLNQAAVEALDSGAPDSAVVYLRRALAEPPSKENRQPLLARLGWAEYLANSPSAAEHLIEALRLAQTPSDRGTLALRVARVLVISEADRSAEAVEILDNAIPVLAQDDSQGRMRLEAQLVAAAGLKLSTRGQHRTWIEKLHRRTLDGAYAERLLLLNLVSSTLREGVVPGHFPDLARRAAEQGSPAQIVRKLSDYALAGEQLFENKARNLNCSTWQLAHSTSQTGLIARLTASIRHSTPRANEDL